MKTTVEISDPLLAEARELAAREKIPLRTLIEEGLRKVLQSRKTAEPFKLRDARVGQGGLTKEFEAKGGWSRLREAAYPGFFDNDDEDDDQ